MIDSSSTRIEREREYHNLRFGEEHDVREPLGRWYAAVDACHRRQNELIRKLGTNKTVLEYGCADGELSLSKLKTYEIADKVYGIDISDKAIEKASRAAAQSGITNCVFQVMNAEHMDFPDNMFDVVFGRGILHHLDYQLCFAEIARVLKPGGKALFTEPLGHNPALNWYRNRTPDMRTPDEHPMVMQDLVLAKTFFHKVDAEFFGLTTLAAVPFQNLPIGALVMRICESVDKMLFVVPFVRRNAWHVLLQLEK